MLEFVLKEGRNRQIRRMCDVVGYHVRALRRTGYGPLRLGDMEPGASRNLTPYGALGAAAARWSRAGEVVRSRRPGRPVKPRPGKKDR